MQLLVLKINLTVPASGKISTTDGRAKHKNEAN
jgi:hypothetical protein